MQPYAMIIYERVTKALSSQLCSRYQITETTEGTHNVNNKNTISSNLQGASNADIKPCGTWRAVIR